MITEEKIIVTKGSDNVFEDLGFSPKEAMNLKIRTDLMIELRAFILEKGWTQSEAAQFFNETQPRISNLMNLDVTRFSVDKLINMVALTNMKINLKIS
ncbi:XRE family transcriptional regulator [Cyanobacterium aponinum FACHB-4101]|uniref:helix-turn-helix domain-containing protein n=1 Tax=Cyanobacterium aponinum TaxID=379064 RepID=UPI001681A867|nr:helix-turn-helix transcriptional regulator [Cyanobacterium aponinum]MBD2395963.1 XRE family transcriptional regulator [Cyanobacterium aponinum FACHB-4101]